MIYFLSLPSDAKTAALILYICILFPQLSGGSMSITKLLEMLTDGTLEISEDQSGQREALAKVKESVLEYLQFNQYHLPMYAQPGLL